VHLHRPRYEVIGKDGAALARFYGDLFDCKMDEVEGGYYMASAGDGPPPGA
jgi:predicted enzyme related to lactoylglutathione lyase